MGFILSPMQVTSTSFENDGRIPDKYTMDGENVSPQLAWSNAPAEAQSFAVICHDPDAPLIKQGKYGFVHWVLYNIPAETSALEEGYKGGTSGLNDFGNLAYGGPQPPADHGQHNYFFSVIALDKQLDLKEGLSMWELLDVIEPNAIAMNRYAGKFSTGQ